jgi:hypothetical protein
MQKSNQRVMFALDDADDDSKSKILEMNNQ